MAAFHLTDPIISWATLAAHRNLFQELSFRRAGRAGCGRLGWRQPAERVALWLRTRS
jgi:hypothetical protein